MKPNAILGNATRKYVCIVDADESTRPRLEGAGHKPHQDHITAKGTNSVTHYSLVHKFIPMPQAFKIQMQRRQWRKNGQKLKKLLAWQLTKVRNKKEVIDVARNKGSKVHVASLMHLCHLKNTSISKI